MQDERPAVLVVEDDIDLREVIALALQRAGFRVVTVANGQQALDYVSKAMPALIVLDMTMPVMDGWEFNRRFREQYGEDTPILVLTAAEDARRRAEEIDLQHHLDKPFSVRELVRITERLVAKGKPQSFAGGG